MNLLIIIPHQPHTTGNHVSANRFALSLSQLGWQVRILEVAETETLLIREALDFAPDMVLLVHAYRTGRPWLLSHKASDLPYAVLMTGTDFNQDLAKPLRAAIINQVLAGAEAVLVQNRLAFVDLQGSAYTWRSKVKLLSPGILLGQGTYPIRANLGLKADDFLMLHPASLRAVKGNLALLQMAGDLLNTHSRLHLAFCGPPLDTDYAKQFLALQKLQIRAHYLGEIPCEAMPDALLQADLVLNNSSSEGVPNALVEAASLGRPILARNIPGNCTVVMDERNGLLFDDVADFERQLLRLLTDSDLRHRLSRPDPLTFSAKLEGERLAAILKGQDPGRVAPD